MNTQIFMSGVEYTSGAFGVPPPSAEPVGRRPQHVVVGVGDQRPVDPVRFIRVRVGVDGNEIATRPDRRDARASTTVEDRSEEHTSELQSQSNLVCRLLLEKKKYNILMSSKQSEEPRRKVAADERHRNVQDGSGDEDARSPDHLGLHQSAASEMHYSTTLDI